MDLDTQPMPLAPAAGVATPDSHRADAVSVRALNQSFAVVRYDAEGKVRAANYLFLRLMGVGLGELLGQDTSRFISSADDRGRLLERWQRLRQGERFTETALWIARSGKEVWLESRWVPLTDAAGRVEAVMQIAEDVGRRLAREVEEHSQIMAIQETHAVAHLSLDGRLLWANDRFEQACGYTLAELQDQPHAMLVPEDERDSPAYHAFWEGLRAGRHQAAEFRRRHKDGHDFWLQAVYAPILDPAGRAVKVIKWATDVTEEKLRKADFQWQVTAIHKSSCVVTFDMNGAILDANDRFLEGTGYTLGEIRGRHHRIFVDPAHVHSTEYATFWAALQRGEHREGLYQRFGRDGREIWLQATYNPIFDAAGRAVKIVKYATVVTEERRLQAEHQGQIAAIHEAQCVISFDLEGRVLDANENFLRAMGYRFAEVKGRHHRLFVRPVDAASPEYEAFWRDLAAGRHCRGEYRRIAKDGRDVWLQATYNPIRDLNGHVVKVVKIAADVSVERLRQADFQGQIEAVRKSQDMVVFALDGTIIDVNERFCRTMNYTREELLGQHHSMLVDRDVSASAEYVDFWDQLRRGEYSQGMVRRLGRHGKEVWLQASYNPILDIDGRPTKVVKFASDVTKEKSLAAAHDELQRLTEIDAATALPNRAKLTNFLTACMADPCSSVTLIAIDLDHFGMVNEAHGLRAGDRVLGEVADRIRRLLREDQMLARVGGDEFLIAAPGMGAEAVDRFCRTLLARVSEPIAGASGEKVSVTVSLGVAMSPTDGDRPEDLDRAANQALGTAKKNGRAGVAWFSDEVNARLHGQRKLKEEMRQSYESVTAGANTDFFLVYQPRFDARRRTVRSVEALMRWKHPERGIVSPVDFIPLAEQSGMIVRLGEWALRTACEAAMRWGNVGVSVNLSPVQFRDDELVSKVSGILAATGLPPERLELEITEGVLVNDGVRARNMLHALKALGVSVAIDDFGTGYSSLSQLRDFPFDVLKIDRSFVNELFPPPGKDSSRPVVQAIVALGKALHLQITAEGVEHERELELLVEDGCDEVQGFLLSRPVPASEIDRIVSGKLSVVPAAA